LLTAAGREVSRAAPLVLDYDAGDAESHAVAERVAVNLQAVGIAVRIFGHMAGNNANSTAADLRLVRHHIDTPDPATALDSLLSWAGEPAADVGTPQQSFAAESGPIDDFHVIPLAQASETYGLGSRVRDWMAPPWGSWRLNQVWLAPVAAGGTSP
jgi:hypothetical protein